jgi:hypothetical protein
MSVPPAPPFDDLEGRVFSFYPPIVNVENNEWRLKEATWSEFVVANTQSAIEVAVPRGFLGPISMVDKPVMIVGLNRELEYKAGQVWPTAKKVVSMPGKPMAAPIRMPGGPVPEGPRGLEAITGVGGSATDTRISRMILVTLGSLTFLAMLVWALVRFTPEARPTFTAKDQSYLELTREDDYYAVTRRLGKPSADRWKPGESELKYRALVYKDRGYAIILMGTEQEGAHYIGTMGMGLEGKDWKMLHYVEYARGASTASMLRSLPRF